MTTSAHADMLDDQRHGAELEACHERMVSPRFAQALRDNPQSRRDWLAVAAQLSDDYERGFCLRRAEEAR
jgi:hypothetical protein